MFLQPVLKMKQHRNERRVFLTGVMLLSFWACAPTQPSVSAPVVSTPPPPPVDENMRNLMPAGFPLEIRIRMSAARQSPDWESLRRVFPLLADGVMPPQFWALLDHAEDIFIGAGHLETAHEDVAAAWLRGAPSSLKCQPSDENSGGIAIEGLPAVAMGKLRCIALTERTVVIGDADAVARSALQLKQYPGANAQPPGPEPEIGEESTAVLRVTPRNEPLHAGALFPLFSVPQPWLTRLADAELVLNLQAGIRIHGAVAFEDEAAVCLSAGAEMDFSAAAQRVFG
jgi:hypothetical protein